MSGPLDDVAVIKAGPMDQSLFQLIAARSATLHERLGAAPAQGAGAASEQATRIMERWRSMMGSFDPSRLDRRLAWAGLDIERTAAALVADAPEPGPWSETLAEILSDCDQPKPAVGHGFVDLLVPNEPVPFQEALLPVLKTARRLLWDRLDADPVLPWRHVHPSAIHAVERQLLWGLSEVAALAVWDSFHASRPLGMSMLGAMIPDAASPGTEHYDVFVTDPGCLTAIMRTYPVVGRLVATRVRNWIGASAYLLERLEEDWPLLQAMAHSLGRGAVLGDVTHVATGLSDSHAGGQQVAILHFACGHRIVYKPRDLRLSAAFQDLLRWLSRREDLGLRALTVSSRGGYGWIEYVEPTRCETPDRFHDFYERAGSLLALQYVLGSTDCHYENLMAVGDQPIIVDCETLLQPRQAISADYEPDGLASNSADWRFRDSLLRVGMVPQWNRSHALDRMVDSSALGAPPIETDIPRLVWHNPNSDLMQPQIVKAAGDPRAHLPFTAEGSADSTAYEGDLRAGVARMYRLLEVHRDALLGEDGPLQRFAGLPIRHVFRPTEVYAEQLQIGFQPDRLHDGIAWSTAYEMLVLAFLDAPERPRDWAIFQAEVTALAQLDVPRFVTDTNSLDLHWRGATFPAFFSESALDGAKRRCAALSTVDLDFQLRLLDAAHATRSVRMLQSTTNETDENELELELELENATPLNRDAALSEARRIADELEACSIVDESGVPHWLDIAHSAEHGSAEMRLSGHSFYSGCTGIALFLATLATIDGERDDLWWRALAPVTKRLGTAQSAGWIEKIGPGGGEGIGGVLYCLAQIRRLATAHDELDQSLAHLAGADLTGMIQRSTTWDIIAGIGGLLLGLLAAFEVQPDPRWLVAARAAGDRLLQIQAAHTGGWPQYGMKVAPAGFSHGAAGIAFALIQLHAATGDQRYLRAAHRGMEYEQSLFDAQQENWPVLAAALPSAGADFFKVTWCHGAPGIALSRLSARPWIEDPEVQRALTAGLHTTARHPMGEIDQVCCGNLGRANVLLSASREPCGEQWEARSRDLLAGVVARAQRQGGYRLFQGRASGLYNPGFFQGTAGIGYTLLRFAAPDDVPDALRFELCRPQVSG